MSLEAVESGEILDQDFQVIDNDCVKVWNGRSVTLRKISGNEKLTDTILILISDHSLESKPITCGFLEDYFDSDLKKQNEFDMAVYQYHVRCNNEESKKALEEAFVKMSIGMLGIVIGVARFMTDPIGGPLAIYWCAKGIWMGVEDFKRAMATSGVNLEDVQLVTWYEDLKRNTDEIMNSTILEPWRPLETPNYHYNDNPHYNQPLDSWRYA